MNRTRLQSKHLIYAFLFLLIGFSACQSKEDPINPVIQPITESVYASGVVVSQNQYQVYTSVSGIVENVFVEEGSTVDIGSPLLSIENDAQKLSSDNAKLSAQFNSLELNQGKIEEARSEVELSKRRLEHDASLLARQNKLWSQRIGSKVELEQRELTYKSSERNYSSAKEKLEELQRELDYLSKQAQNNLLISSKNSDNFLVTSKVKGKVYQMNLSKGEMVTPQIPIAVIGDSEKYFLEMQIDEYDIVSIQLGMPVLVMLNSYRDSVFNAVVTKINPIMNTQTRAFTIEAEFVRAPNVLYPNISFEANVLIHTKDDALLIPRNYLLDDSIVVNKFGQRLTVRTGLKDFQMVEILSGIGINEELILPVK